MNDKIIVVTAGRGRLGRTFTRVFQEHGATVVTIDRSRPAEGADHAFIADLAYEPDVEACFRKIDEAVGRIDALVHTAGTWAMTPLAETSLADWRALLDANLTTAFLCFREAARRMAAQGGGRLIGFSAGQGADRGTAKQGAYAAAKGGVIRLVEAAAAEFADRGVTAHAIAPSTILYGDEDDDAKGVPAEALADACRYLIGPAGDAHNGAVLRAYGTSV